VVALEAPLSVIVAPAALIAGANVPEMFVVGAGEGEAAEEVTPVLPHPEHRTRMTDPKRHTKPV